MTGERIVRRLAAILAADVVGYSRLMGRDEHGTVSQLKAHRTERLEPVVARHGGRLVKLTGDGALVEFPSAVDALGAAIQFQQAMTEANRSNAEDTRIVFRIGLHLGDLLVEGDDLYGDGVNIAARLEGEAPAGGIVISRTVHEAVMGRLNANFDDLGNLALKNIERPVQAFRVKWEPSDWQLLATTEEMVAPLSVPQVQLPLPDKPSIAVLPFTNISGDPEQEYFADGMVEEIITALSRFKSLFVIARNSSFAYKGSSPDIRQVGRELGVRYVLEGSVRKSGKRVRITAQLIDSQTGSHLWADRFDSALEDLFELQDQVTANIVGAIAPKIDLAEIDRAKRKPVESLDAYDCFLRGMADMYQRRKETCDEALRLAYRAIELDPEFPTPYGLAANCYAFRKNSAWVSDEQHENNETRRLAMKVQLIGGEDGYALAWAGRAMAFVCRDYEMALSMTERATLSNPNLATAWFYRGTVNLYCGNYEEGIDQILQVLRMSSMDPELHQFEGFLGWGYLFLCRYEDAIKWSSRALWRRPDVTTAFRVSAAANALVGNIKEARRAVAAMLDLEPQVTVSYFRKITPYRRIEDVDRVLEGLRLAGLPE